MQTYTQILYQVTFHTRNNEKTLLSEKREELYSYIAKVISNKNCHAYRIGGIEDHIHIILRLHPNIALSKLIKDIKMSSSSMIKRNNIFPNFYGWQKGFGAFTYSEDALLNLIKYVDKQEEHHKNESSKEELIKTLQSHNVDFNEKYLF